MAARTKHKAGRKKKRSAKKSARRGKTARHEPILVKSQAEVARLLNVSPARVTQWKQEHIDCPIRGKPPWSLDAIIEWRSRALEPTAKEHPLWDPNKAESNGKPATGSITPNDLSQLPPDRRAKTIYVLTRTQAAKFDHDVRKGLFLPAEDVRQERINRSTTFRVVMESLAPLIRNHPDLDGLEDHWRNMIEEVTKTIVAEALIRMAGRKPGAQR